jgi:transposase-like protein
VWMPWRESSVMEERLRFVARLLDGEPMTDLCREFGMIDSLCTSSSSVWKH